MVEDPFRLGLHPVAQQGVLPCPQIDDLVQGGEVGGGEVVDLRHQPLAGGIGDPGLRRGDTVGQFPLAFTEQREDLRISGEDIVPRVDPEVEYRALDLLGQPDIVGDDGEIGDIGLRREEAVSPKPETRRPAARPAGRRPTIDA